MLIGPVFTREAITAPRRLRFYVLRTAFVAALFGLMLTSWQIMVGAQQVDNPGDLARFSAAVFQILAPLQVAVALPFSALLTAAAVAQEKDRRTLVLLLMTRLTNSELVLGKLLASLLTVLVVIAAALPLFMIAAGLGGVSYSQIFRVFGVTLGTALVSGSLGSLIALWREKTFQALAMTALAIVLWIVGWEIAAQASAGQWLTANQADRLHHLAEIMSPWRAVLAAAQPRFVTGSDPISLAWGGVPGFLIAAICGTLLLNGVAIVMVRRWNPSRESRPQSEQLSQASAPSEELAEETEQGGTSQRAIRVHGAGGKVRAVWDNPILWREMRTWAYGKKILVVHVTYWIIFAVCAAAVIGIVQAEGQAATARDILPPVATPLVPLLLVSLILLNALAVTSLTNERDGRALDLLLVTDLTPKEIIYGKLGGALYNAKEMILLPLVLCGYLWFAGHMTTENYIFLVIGLLTMYAFAVVLGLHCGMTYGNSRMSIATSIGTLLFLFLGVATCMRIMLAFSSSFENQFGAFFGIVVGGGVALYATLAPRNRSAAMGLAFIAAPFLTFFAITSFLLQNFGPVFLITTLTYGFATAAMLVPAVSEFDVATGRTQARPE